MLTAEFFDVIPSSMKRPFQIVLITLYASLFPIALLYSFYAMWEFWLYMAMGTALVVGMPFGLGLLLFRIPFRIPVRFRRAWKISFAAIAAMVACSTVATCSATLQRSPSSVHVSGYTRSDGRSAESYSRRAPGMAQADRAANAKTDWVRVIICSGGLGLLLSCWVAYTILDRALPAGDGGQRKSLEASRNRSQL